MIDWESVRQNGSYWVLKLLVDNFRPGNTLIQASVRVPSSLGFLQRLSAQLDS